MEKFLFVFLVLFYFMLTLVKCLIVTRGVTDQFNNLGGNCPPNSFISGGGCRCTYGRTLVHDDNNDNTLRCLPQNKIRHMENCDSFKKLDKNNDDGKLNDHLSLDCRVQKIVNVYFWNYENVSKKARFQLNDDLKNTMVIVEPGNEVQIDYKKHKINIDGLVMKLVYHCHDDQTKCVIIKTYGHSKYPIRNDAFISQMTSINTTLPTFTFPKVTFPTIPTFTFTNITFPTITMSLSSKVSTNIPSNTSTFPSTVATESTSKINTKTSTKISLTSGVNPPVKTTLAITNKDKNTYTTPVSTTTQVRNGTQSPPIQPHAAKEKNKENTIIIALSISVPVVLMIISIGLFCIYKRRSKTSKNNDETKKKAFEATLNPAYAAYESTKKNEYQYTSNLLLPSLHQQSGRNEKQTPKESEYAMFNDGYEMSSNIYTPFNNANNDQSAYKELEPPTNNVIRTEYSALNDKQCHNRESTYTILETPDFRQSTYSVLKDDQVTGVRNSNYSALGGETPTKFEHPIYKELSTKENLPTDVSDSHYRALDRNTKNCERDSIYNEPENANSNCRDSQYRALDRERDSMYHELEKTPPEYRELEPSLAENNNNVKEYATITTPYGIKKLTYNDLKKENKELRCNNNNNNEIYNELTENNSADLYKGLEKPDSKENENYYTSVGASSFYQAI